MTVSRAHLARREILLRFAFATLVVSICAALLAAAALAPAPPLVLPLVILVGIGGPMAAALELSLAIGLVRRLRAVRGDVTANEPLDADTVEALCGLLAALPETPHPLGL